MQIRERFYNILCVTFCGKFSFTTGNFVFRALPSSNLSRQLRPATAVAVFSSDVHLQLATNIASGKLQVLSSLREYFIAFHCVLYFANSCLKQSVKLKTSQGSVTFPLSSQQSSSINVTRLFQTYHCSIINFRSGRF